MITTTYDYPNHQFIFKTIVGDKLYEEVCSFFEDDIVAKNDFLLRIRELKLKQILE